MPKTSKLFATAMMLLAPISYASAEQIAGLTFDQKIVTFDSSMPMTIASSFAITGLTAGDNLIGIDLRPANNFIYGVSQTGRVYTLTTAGIASLVTTLSVLPTGGKFGFDFNPMADRLRIIAETDQNLAANVGDGVTASQTGITRANGGPIDILGSAYTNNFAGATSTVLYGIDSVTDSLVTTAAPGGGIYSTVGGLGVGLTNANHVSFDISGSSGLAYLNIDSAFYRINLATGATSFVDTIGSGPLIGITATGPVPEPGTWAMMILGFGLVGASMRRRTRTRVALV
jgi:Domain of unknown function (DUF4394)/PEP-CTERM motif